MLPPLSFIMCNSLPPDGAAPPVARQNQIRISHWAGKALLAGEQV